MEVDEMNRLLHAYATSSWMWILLTAVLLIGYSVYARFALERRINRLGCRATTVLPYRLPYGFDIAFRIFRSILQHRLIEVQQEILQHGHIVEVQMAGSAMIFSDDPEVFRACMSTKFVDFGKGALIHDVFQGSMAEGIFCTDGPTWRRSRSILRPHCAKARDDDLNITESHFTHLSQKLGAEDEAVNLLGLFDRYQLDVATHVFFGKSTDSLTSTEQPFRRAIARLLTVASYKLSFGTLGTYVPEWLVARKSMQEVDSYIQSLYDLANSQSDTKSQEKRRNLLDTLADLQLDLKTFKAQVTAILLGGKDPPALTMTWAVWELARNPDVYKRVREEVLQVCGNDAPPTRQDLKNCHFVHAVVQESLRLYHPLGINMKVALRDTSLPIGGGSSGMEPLAVLKGTPVVLSTWSLQRRTDLIGPDAAEFRPSRWETWKPGQWEFVPFNRGGRTCLGKNFGQEQVEYLIARLAQEFSELKVGEEQKLPMEYMCELNVKPLWPCLVKFIR